VCSRGGGRDRPEAACPAGSRAADGEAGGFNAVQKLFTNRTSGTPGSTSVMTARTTSGYLETWHRIDVWSDSIQVFGGSLSLAAAHHLLVWLSSGLRPPNTVARRGSRGDCPARSSTAHLAVS